MENIFWEISKTAFGNCLVAEGKNGVVATTLPSHREEDMYEGLRRFKTTSFIRKSTPLLQETTQQIAEYFEGTRTYFDVPLDLRGTPFQIKVWSTLLKIPYGKTWSYHDVATAIDSPKGMRAIGLANSRNPIPILVPCHRVIGKDGSMTGFGGGIELKKKMLELESRGIFPRNRGDHPAGEKIGFLL